MIIVNEAQRLETVTLLGIKLVKIYMKLKKNKVSGKKY